jgi:predicted nucleic acid-binding protein
MLPSRELEFRILEWILQSSISEWHPTTISQLNSSVGNPGLPEVVAALKRLTMSERVYLRKWKDRGFILYTARETDDEFFYRADFQLSIAPEGRPYFEALQQAGRDTRLKLTVYLDTNIVSALAKGDMPASVSAALMIILEMFNREKLALVTSEVSRREIQKIHNASKVGRDKWNHDVVLGFVSKVPIVEDSKVIGFHSQWDRRGGASYPVTEDDPISSMLRGLGLDQTDAHHVMLAINSKCDVFLTCDKRTILNRRAEIEKHFTIKLMDPEELARAVSLVLGP